jgi:hypothetical protein
MKEMHQLLVYFWSPGNIPWRSRRSYAGLVLVIQLDTVPSVARNSQEGRERALVVYMSMQPEAWPPGTRPGFFAQPKHSMT